MTVERDARVFAGQGPSPMAVVRRGYLRKVWLSRDGRRSLIDLHVPGAVVGAVPGHHDAYVLEAATKAELCIFDADSVRRMMAVNGAFRHHVVKLVADRHIDQLEMIWRRGALTSRERIIAFLVYAIDVMPVEPQSDGGVIVTIEISRADWADLTNTTVESICRTLRQLSDKQLISQVAPGRYWIRDVAVLARLAGMDPDLDRFRRSEPAPERAMGEARVSANLARSQQRGVEPASDFSPRNRGSENGRIKDDEREVAR